MVKKMLTIPSLRKAKLDSQECLRVRTRPLLFGTVILPLLVLPASVWALVFDASVDTHQVRMGETFQLTLKIDESSNGNEPDLSALEKDFRVLGKQFGSSTNLSSRGISTETTWVVNLMPKHKGTVTIPALSFDGVLSKPITVSVSGEAQTKTNQNSQQLVFLEADVDSQEVYVQQQVNFTLRLFKRTDLHDPSLIMPAVENAVQEKIGSPRAYSTVIDGREYEVVENRFAYFPQKSGSFVIPPAELNATIAVGGNGFLDPFLGTMGKQIRRLSNSVEITVNPKPADYPSDMPWLPTPHLSIEESIRPDKEDFKVGEPITRVITLEASGVAPSLLPPVPAPEGAGYKVYPEPADTKGLPDANGVSSRRVETHAYIPTRAGTLQLPAIEITYWNTQTHRLDKAVLPGRSFTIKPAPGAQAQAGTPPTPAVADTSRATETTTVHVSDAGVWPWVSAVLLTGWMATLAGWGWHTRKRRKKSPTEGDAQFDESLADRRNALLNACKQHQPITARKALVAWFKAVEKAHPVHSLGHVRQHAMSALLANAAQELEQILYRQSEGIDWNSDALRKGIADEESQRRIKQREQRATLQALHP